jgi:hypothetical protein
MTRLKPTKPGNCWPKSATKISATPKVQNYASKPGTSELATVKTAGVVTKPQAKTIAQLISMSAKREDTTAPLNKSVKTTKAVSFAIVLSVTEQVETENVKMLMNAQKATNAVQTVTVKIYQVQSLATVTPVTALAILTEFARMTMNVLKVLSAQPIVNVETPQAVMNAIAMTAMWNKMELVLMRMNVTVET